MPQDKIEARASGYQGPKIPEKDHGKQASALSKKAISTGNENVPCCAASVPLPTALGHKVDPAAAPT